MTKALIGPDNRPVLQHRRMKAPPGECKACDHEREDEARCCALLGAVYSDHQTRDAILSPAHPFHPPHDASPRCESGGHNHCSCDICF